MGALGVAGPRSHGRLSSRRRSTRRHRRRSPTRSGACSSSATTPIPTAPSCLGLATRRAELPESALGRLPLQSLADLFAREVLTVFGRHRVSCSSALRETSVGGRARRRRTTRGMRMFARRLRAGRRRHLRPGVPGPRSRQALVALRRRKPPSTTTTPSSAPSCGLLATHQPGSQRGQRLVLDLLRSRHRGSRGVGVQLADDRKSCENALERIAGMRGLVSNAVADAAVDATYLIFQRPIGSSAWPSARASQLEDLALVGRDPSRRRHPKKSWWYLAGSPSNGIPSGRRNWLSDPRTLARRSIAVGAYLRRLYSPAPLTSVVRSQGSTVRKWDRSSASRCSTGAPSWGAARCPANEASLRRWRWVKRRRRASASRTSGSARRGSSRSSSPSVGDRRRETPLINRASHSARVDRIPELKAQPELRRTPGSHGPSP